jgi:hypothetical protein
MGTQFDDFKVRQETDLQKIHSLILNSRQLSDDQKRVLLWGYNRAKELAAKYRRANEELETWEL